jgi:hypothetical protein
MRSNSNFPELRKKPSRRSYPPRAGISTPPAARLRMRRSRGREFFFVDVGQVRETFRERR